MTYVKDEALQNRLSRYEELREHTRLLPVKVTSFYQKKLTQEYEALGHREGPLHRVIFPSEDRLLQLDGDREVDDHVNDRSHMPSPQSSFIHKYPDRVLFMPSSECLSHCMYCFRQDILEERHQHEAKPQWEQLLQELIDYLKTHPEVREVILSGGDPLLLPARVIDNIFKSLKDVGIKHLRIHTRSLIFNPASFTKQHMEVCVSYQVRVILHVVHPHEWCLEVSKKARLWSDAGVRLFNQFPVLRKVNDHPTVLSTLVEKLDIDDVRTLSIYFPDPIKYSACYRIPIGRLKTLIQEFKKSSPSWVNGLRFSQDSQIGKLGLEDLASIDTKQSMLTYKRGSDFITVPDLPEELDETYDLKTLLWKRPENLTIGKGETP